MIYHRNSEDNVFWIVYGYAKTCDEDNVKYNLILRLTKTYLPKSGLNNKILSKFNSLLLNANSCVHFSVSPNWVRTTGERKLHVFRLSAGSKEYKDVEAAFHATARNQIVSIERIQNEEIYGLLLRLPVGRGGVLNSLRFCFFFRCQKSAQRSWVIPLNIAVLSPTFKVNF